MAKSAKSANSSKPNNPGKSAGNKKSPKSPKATTNSIVSAAEPQLRPESADNMEPSRERRGTERRKVQRRRQIDPTTCERDYSTEEIEFMRAMDEYKRANGRMFPTCSEILEVFRGLGYTRLMDRTDGVAGATDDEEVTTHPRRSVLAPLSGNSLVAESYADTE